MRCMGGKSRIGNQIAEILNNFSTNKSMLFKSEVFFSDFLSPFCGGLNIEPKLHFDKITISDNNPYLIALYKAIKNNIQLPENLTEDEWKHIKDNPDEIPYLTGLAGLCCYRGSWMRCFARGKRKDRYFGKEYVQEVFTSLKNLGVFLRKNNVFIENKSYEDFKPTNSLIYCDPPYFGVDQRYFTNKFDSDKFWCIIREWSKYNLVFVSEFTYPDDFYPILEINQISNMSGKNKKDLIMREKLIVHNSWKNKIKLKLF